MKKFAIASLSALAGAGRLGNVQVDAGATEYSVTFNGNSTVEKTYGQSPVLSATTSLGNKVGCYLFGSSECATFGSNNYHFQQFRLYSEGRFPSDVYQYASITGIKVNYTLAGSRKLRFRSKAGSGDIENGVRYDWSGSSSNEPYLDHNDRETHVESVTIYYTC